MANFTFSGWATIALVLMFWNNSALAAQPAKGKCYNAGETVTVRGRISGGMNGGTYFELLKPICVNYPKAPNTSTARYLTTIGQKLPANVFLEVTGVLHDAFDRHVVGFDIDTAAFLDVDANVNGALVVKETRCKEWQAENSAGLIKKTHGATLNPVFGNSSTPTRQCGLWAVDKDIPHKLITIWRPEPTN